MQYDNDFWNFDHATNNSFIGVMHCNILLCKKAEIIENNKGVYLYQVLHAGKQEYNEEHEEQNRG